MLFSKRVSCRSAYELSSPRRFHCSMLCVYHFRLLLMKECFDEFADCLELCDRLGLGVIDSSDGIVGSVVCEFCVDVMYGGVSVFCEHLH